jgi:type II secretory pathway pseudopilin PulG
MTLIELLLYVSLLVFIFSALFSTLSIFYSNKIKNRTILEVEQQGLIASLILSQEIRNAQSINSPSAGNSLASLSLEPFDPSRNPLLFSLIADKIVIDEAGDQSNLSSDNVVISNLNFENNSAGETSSIKFSFDVSYNSDSLRQEYKYDKNFSGTANLLK